MDKQTFIETPKLYHYTTFESAEIILTSNALKFSKLSNMNDINESYRPVIDSLGMEISLEWIGQISLTQDGNRKGYAIPSLWGHYAQKGNGVCLVFDKAKLLGQVDDAFEYYDYIRYDDAYDNTIFTNGEYSGDYISKHRAELFFTKKADWAYEQEYRIMGENRDFLNFGDSLMAVILCFTDDIEKGKPIFNSVNAQSIKHIMPKDATILQFSYAFGNPKLTNENGNIWSINN